MSYAKLKPCPFCGSNKIVVWHHGSGCEVKCIDIIEKPDGDIDIKGCGGRMIVQPSNKFPRGIRTLSKLYEFCKRKCIKKWNNRSC